MINMNTDAIYKNVNDQSLALYDFEGISEEKIKTIQIIKNTLIDLKMGMSYMDRVNKLKEYKNYDSLTYNNIREDKYIVQSITSIEDKMLISAYRKNENSRIYIYDLKTGELEGKIILDNKAHVGGISYDKKNKILFVTGSNGEINTYDFSIIDELNSKYDREYTINFSDEVELPNEKKVEIKIANNINIRDLDANAEASTIYYYNNRLYVATFDPVDKGKLYSYPVYYDNRKKELIIADNTITNYKIGPRIQGIGITSYNDIDYLVCTQSIGITKSVFLLYEIKNDGLNFIGRKYLNEMGLEGITIDDKGYIVGIFENNSRGVIVTNIMDLVEQVSDSWLGMNPGNEIVSWIGGEVYKLTHK